MILPWRNKEQYILSLFKEAHQQAMDKLYMQYADYMTGICARYISDEDTIKDVLQESFIKIFTQIHKFEYRGKGSLKAWLTKVVVNEALIHLQKNKEIFVPLQDDLPDEDPNVENLGADVLFAFIQKLPDGYRTVFNLFVVEGKSHKEIAEILHIQPATSASQFLRARKLLAEMIQEYKLQMENR